MLKNIPQNRLLLYLLILGLIPLTLVLLNYFSKQSQLDDLQNTLSFAKQKAYTFEKKQSSNIAVRNFYRNADHFYIDKNLETIRFLSPEIENLKAIKENKNYTPNPDIEKRYTFLTGNGNHLTFVEGIVQTYPYFQETIETLAHPVEVNVEDIKKILSRIEGVNIGSYEPGPNRPQLIILDFKLDKKKGEVNDVFVLNMKLLKREFL